MGPRGFWITLAIVLFLAYLVARPHVVAVYVEEMANGPIGGTTINTFPTEENCEEAATLANNVGMRVVLHSGKRPRVVAFHCKSSTRLLWGW